MKKVQSSFNLFAYCFIANAAFAGEIGTQPSSRPHLNIHVGAFQNTAGKEQQVNINLVPSADYEVKTRNNWNVLVGLGLLKNNTIWKQPLSYGIVAFYLSQTRVSGNIVQANLFSNLSYSYKMTSVPIYAMGKTYLTLNPSIPKIALDLGIGPNIMRLANYQERIINPQTEPDNAYKARTTTDFSVTVGVGFGLDNLFAHLPVECGYRFFYLGEGNLGVNNDQYQTRLSTGTSYANAIACTLVI